LHCKEIGRERHLFRPNRARSETANGRNPTSNQRSVRDNKSKECWRSDLPWPLVKGCKLCLRRDFSQWMHYHSRTEIVMNLDHLSIGPCGGWYQRGLRSSHKKTQHHLRNAGPRQNELLGPSVSKTRPKSRHRHAAKERQTIPFDQVRLAGDHVVLDLKFMSHRSQVDFDSTQLKTLKDIGVGIFQLRLNLVQGNQSKGPTFLHIWRWEWIKGF